MSIAKLNGPCGCCGGGGCFIPSSAVASEDWSNDGCGLNVPLVAWGIIAGNIDVVGDGCSFVILPGNGKMVDLAGSPGLATIRTILNWTAGAGDHKLVVWAAGDQRTGSGTNTFQVSYGTLIEQVTVAWDSPMTKYEWTVPGGTSAQVFLEQISAPTTQFGNLISCVYLYPTEAP